MSGAYFVDTHCHAVYNRVTTVTVWNIRDHSFKNSGNAYT